jgi:hypothetical protein
MPWNHWISSCICFVSTLYQRIHVDFCFCVSALLCLIQQEFVLESLLLNTRLASEKTRWRSLLSVLTADPSTTMYEILTTDFWTKNKNACRRFSSRGYHRSEPQEFRTGRRTNLGVSQRQLRMFPFQGSPISSDMGGRPMHKLHPPRRSPGQG